MLIYELRGIYMKMHMVANIENYYYIHRKICSLNEKVIRLNKAFSKFK